MKVDIAKGGTLIIYAENSLEAYALKEWWKDYTSENNTVSFGIDTNWYENKCEVNVHD